MTKKDLMKDPKRVRDNGEVFTPPNFAKQIFSKWMKISNRKPTDVFIDLQCGQGSLLCAVLEWKIDRGLSYEEALSTILGVDIAEDNVEECRANLLSCVQGKQGENYRQIVSKNIIQGDSVKNTLCELFPKHANNSMESLGPLFC